MKSFFIGYIFFLFLMLILWMMGEDFSQRNEQTAGSFAFAVAGGLIIGCISIECFYPKKEDDK